MWLYIAAAYICLLTAGVLTIVRKLEEIRDVLKNNGKKPITAKRRAYLKKWKKDRKKQKQ